MENEKIKLRLIAFNDAERIVELLRDPEMAEWMLNLPHPYSIKNAHDFLHDVVDKKFVYVIVSKQTDQVVGTIGLLDRDKIEGERELGYWVGKSEWGNGFASAAINLIVQHAFHVLKIKAVYAHVFEPNLASQKVLLKNGFHFTIRIKGKHKINPEIDMLEYRLEKKRLVIEL